MSTGEDEHNWGSIILYCCIGKRRPASARIYMPVDKRANLRKTVTKKFVLWLQLRFRRSSVLLFLRRRVM